MSVLSHYQLERIESIPDGPTQSSAVRAFMNRVATDSNILLTARLLGLATGDSLGDEVVATEYRRQPFRMVPDPRDRRVKEARGFLLCNEAVMFPHARSWWGEITHLIFFRADSTPCGMMPLTSRIYHTADTDGYGDDPPYLGQSVIFRAGSITYDASCAWRAGQ